jgi:hypothetical protein
MAAQRSRTPERKARAEAPAQLQEIRCTTTKQGTLHKLASGAVAEGGWLALGSSQRRADYSKYDMESWHPQHVTIELTETILTQSASQQPAVSAAIRFGAPGQAATQGATGKIQLESCSDIQYSDGATDFIVVSDCNAAAQASVLPGCASHGL